MPELKTLKDFDTYINYDIDGEIPYECAKVDDLRQEAIKWIKELSVINEERYQEFCITCFKKVDGEEAYQCWKNKHFLATTDWEESSDFSCMIGIIKHLYNISEEDFK